MRLTPTISRLATAITFVLAITLASAHAYATTNWSVIQQALGNSGTLLPNGVLRYELVRSDLTSLAVNGVPAVPSVLAAGYLAFAPIPNNTTDVYITGAIPLQETEVSIAVDFLRAVGMTVSAVVNEALGENPKLEWVYFAGQGTQQTLATGLQQGMGALANPQNVAIVPMNAANNYDGDGITALPASYQQIISIGILQQLGPTGAFEFLLPLATESTITVNGIAASVGLGIAHVFYFEPLSDGTVNFNVELALAPAQVKPVINDLRGLGLSVTAQHNHFLPATGLYYVHVFYHGDGTTLMDSLTAGLPQLEKDLGYVQ